MARIAITDLSLRTIIGTNDWEREVLQDVILNVEIDFDATKAAVSDQLTDTVDYKALTKKIIQFVEHSQYYLLEKLAAGILDIVMSDAKVLAASVKVEKPQALRFAKTVSVELRRSNKSLPSRQSEPGL